MEISLRYLKDIFKISLGYLWDIFGISLGYLCDVQSKVSCPSFFLEQSILDHDQIEICRHKLGRKRAGWGDILVDIVLFIIDHCQHFPVFINIFIIIITKRGKDVENLLEG